MAPVIAQLLEGLCNHMGYSANINQYLRFGQRPPSQHPENAPPPQYDPSPSTTFQALELGMTKYDAMPKDAVIGFEMIPNIHAPHTKCLDWLAFLAVQTKDVGFLMREGFSWSENNVQQQKGCFQFGNQVTPDSAKDHGWTCARTYSLADSGENPMWTAKLTVYAREPGILSRFRPSVLAIEHVILAIAVDSRGFPIYSYYALEPEHSFNALFDDMPMTGWWPWPRLRWWPRRAQQTEASTVTTAESSRASEMPYQGRNSGNI